MINYIFHSHYLIPSIYASSTQANKMIVIHIPLFIQLCIYRCVTRWHFSLNALLHTSQVYGCSPLYIRWWIFNQSVAWM